MEVAAVTGLVAFVRAAGNTHEVPELAGTYTAEGGALGLG